MAEPLAVTKFNELVETLNVMLKDRTRINEFALKRIEKDAKKLPEKCNQYVISGMVACLKSNIDDMHHFHKNAIRLSPANYDVKLQYFVSLRSLELYPEAFDLCKSMYAENPKDDVALCHMVIMAVKLGHKDDLDSYLSKHINMYDPSVLDKLKLKGRVFMLRHDIADYVDGLLNFINNNFSNIVSLDTSCYTDPELNTESLSIDLVVDSDVDRFLEEYSTYSSAFVKSIPVEKMDYIHLNYAFV